MLALGARLRTRIYEAFPLRCPECGAEMRILAFLTAPGPAGAVLRPLDLPHNPPRLSPARGPPHAPLDLALGAEPADALPADDFDPTPAYDPAYDPAEPEPVPELDLDPTRGA